METVILTHNRVDLGSLRIRALKADSETSVRIATLKLSAETWRALGRVAAASTEYVLLLNTLVNNLEAEFLAHRTEINHAIVNEVIHSHSEGKNRVRNETDITNHYVLVLAVRRLLGQGVENPPLILFNPYYRPELNTKD